MKHIVLSLSASFYIILDALFSRIFNFFHYFSLQTLQFICVSTIIILMSYVLVTEKPFRRSCKLSVFHSSVFQIRTKFRTSGFTRICQFEIFSVSDCIIHSSLVVFEMFSALFFYATNVILPKFENSDKIIVLNKQ